MPIFRNLRPNTTPVPITVAGSEGESRAVGLQSHWYTYDMAGHPSQAGVTVNIFDPSAAILPVVFLRVLVRFDLANADTDFAIVQIGGNVIDELLKVGNFLDDDDNGQIWGRQANQSNTGQGMYTNTGAILHNHWIRPDSTGLIMPIRMHVNTAISQPGPYIGKIFVQLLYVSLA